MAELTKAQIKQTTKWTSKEYGILAGILLIIVAAVVVVWVQFGPFLMNQAMIESYVKLNETKLEIIAMDMIERDFEYPKDGYDTKRDEKGAISIHFCTKRPDMVQFDTWAFGLAPSSRHYGFYYSLNDEPILYLGQEYELTPDGDGWSWQQPDSDNRGYTEKIINNWYYYEMHF